MDERFKQGKIYKLVSKLTSKIYVGSTTQILNQRLLQHKAAYKSFLKKKGNYMTSFELLQHEDVDIELIETILASQRMNWKREKGNGLKN